MNFTTTHIRSEKVTIDTRIYTILNGRKKPGEVYLAAIAPDMELTIITLDESPMVYKSMEEIVAQIGPTAEIIERIRPVYNFKAAD